MEELNILHISDLHCGIEADIGTQETDLERRRETLRLFFDGFQEKIPQNWMPHVIAISGDLGWSGRENEYIRKPTTPKHIIYTVSEFLDKLAIVAGTDRIICCPGNHDKQLKAGLEPYREIKRPLSGKDIIQLLPCFKSYSSEMSKYDSCKLDNNPLYLDPNAKKRQLIRYLYGYRLFDVEQFQIMFIVMNSAWLCDYQRNDGTDQGQLQLGVNQVQEIVRLLFENRIDTQQLPVVVLFHHPAQSWLAETERNDPNDTSSLDRLKNISKNILFLHGHQHFPESADSSINIAGTISSRDTRNASCNILKIRTAGKFACVKKGTYQLQKDEKGNPVQWIWYEEISKNPDDPSPIWYPINSEILLADPIIQKLLSNAIDKKTEVERAHKNQDNATPVMVRAHEELDSLIKQIQSLTSRIANGCSVNDKFISANLQEISHYIEQASSNLLQMSDINLLIDTILEMARTSKELDNLEHLEPKSSNEILSYLKRLKDALMRNALFQMDIGNEQHLDNPITLQI